MKHGSTLSVALAAVFFGPSGAYEQTESQDSIPSAQEAVQIRGQVSDVVTRHPLSSASIEVYDLEAEGALTWQGMSDSTGIFVGPRLLPSLYQIRAGALGYRSISHMVPLSGYGSVDLDIELSPDALELEPLVVVTRRRSALELNGFYERRRRGFGHSLNRAEIEARRPMQVTDLARTLPGVSVTPGYLGRGGILRMRNGCVPDVILDGVRMGSPVRLDEILQVSDLEGIEVYSGATSPMQYSQSTCGTVMAWTREPGGVGGNPWTWKRAGAAMGFLLLGFLLTR
jgi:hypothetical protein